MFCSGVSTPWFEAKSPRTILENSLSCPTLIAALLVGTTAVQSTCLQVLIKCTLSREWSNGNGHVDGWVVLVLVVLPFQFSTSCRIEAKLCPLPLLSLTILPGFTVIFEITLHETPSAGTNPPDWLY